MQSFEERQGFTDHMRLRKAQNMILCRYNKNENLVCSLLGLKRKGYKRQAMIGARLFDFWFSRCGVAIEVDGPGHNREKDRKSDEEMFRKRAIVVLRVKNGDVDGTNSAIDKIKTYGRWNSRRRAIGNIEGRHPLIEFGDKGTFYHEKYLAREFTRVNPDTGELI